MKPDRILKLFAITAPGLEGVCAREMLELGLPEVAVEDGGVRFSGGLRELYRANLWLRSASRILVRFGDFRCRSFPELFQGSQRLPWGTVLRLGTRVQVRATSHQSRLIHTGRIGETLGAAIEAALGPREVPAGSPTQLVLVRICDDHCQLSIDTSGELLHRRGYREETGHAPLRETLAASLLDLAGWGAGEALVDPTCGSGTIVIEAALRAARIAPGTGRSFAFMDWPGYRPGLWQALLGDAAKLRREVPVSIQGSDRAPQIIAAAVRNAERAGVAGLVRLEPGDLADLRLPAGPGLVLCNPPYGERLGQAAELPELFASLGAAVRRGGSGWRCAFLAPGPELAKATGLTPRSVARLSNGGLEIELFLGGSR